MKLHLDELNLLTTAELQAVVDKDVADNGELLLELEGELMSLMQAAIFPHSETFGDEEEETSAERHLRVLIESMDFATTLSAINAIHSLANNPDADL